ncbi:MAG: type II toxin-antitoxin system RelE/ParE family toxin [Bacteroidia bacterium]|nr:type II toxin-antitoxin system RelE/ParE family toxin [Bacteroidia bacterium]
MARRIVWSRRAHVDRLEIIQYWNTRNKSYGYSRRLNGLIVENLRLISKYPMIGRPSDYKNVRLKPVRNYLIIYRFSNERIEVLAVWDCNRNPEELKSYFTIKT